MTEIYSLLSNTFRSFGLKKCIQSQTLTLFEMEVLVGIHFFGRWLILVVFFHIVFVPLIEESVFIFKHWSFWHGNTCRNPFSKRWQKLIVILYFSIHFLLWLKKCQELSNTEIFWHGNWGLNTFFKKWQKFIVFFHIHYVPLV